MREHLSRKGFHEEIVEITVTRLESEKFLDDSEYAELFVNQRARLKPKSRFALSYELKKKGVADSVIERALVGTDDLSSALHAIEPRLQMWQSYDREKLKKKVMNYLRNRGFSYEICITIFNRVSSIDSDAADS